MCWNCPQFGIWPRCAKRNHSGGTDWHSNIIYQIRQYAIHKLLTDQIMLSSLEKILLVRAHRVGTWLDEAVKSLVVSNSIPTLEDLVILGWETVTWILWIKDNFPPKTLPGQCTGLMEYWPQKTWQYWFHPYTSLMPTSSSRRTPSHLVKLNDDIHKPLSDISAEHHQWPFNPSTIWSPSLSQPFNGELGTRVTLPMLQITMK